jgi:hypothetical protein
MALAVKSQLFGVTTAVRDALVDVAASALMPQTILELRSGSHTVSALSERCAVAVAVERGFMLGIQRATQRQVGPDPTSL